MTHNFTLVDWSMGSDEEPVVAGKEGVFRFVRRREADEWKKSEYITLTNNSGFLGAGEVSTGKLPGGKDFIVTIEPMHGNHVVAYTTPKGDRPISFSARHIIDDSLSEGHAVACGDLLGIGSHQVVAGWRGQCTEGKVGIKIFTPLDSDGQNWRTTILDENTMACEDLCVADLNGDSKPDIVASGRTTKNVKVYFNTTK